ncbi:hypothetical protein ACFE04_009241 [Oxalis oulophora]
MAPITKQTDHHHQRKRLKSISTSITKPERHDTNRFLPVSITNRFLPIKSLTTSSSSPFSLCNPKKRKKHHRKRISRDGYRNWVFNSSRHLSHSKDKVTVVSYNILGVGNALNHSDLYTGVPCKFLDWDWRKKLICQEVKEYNGGILCFQEVDRFDDLNDLLQKDGFIGVYKHRTGDAEDGCAMFWKANEFTLLHEENIEYKSFGLRNNVAQLCIFEMNQNQPKSDTCTEETETLTHKRCFLVGNIHVLFNPNRGDIKLGQIRLLVDRAHKLSEERGSIPVVLAGDFNSIPQSALYQFVESSRLNIQLHDRRKISGLIKPEENMMYRDRRFQYKNPARNWIPRQIGNGWSAEEITLATGNENITNMEHQLKLSSAYAAIPGNSGTRDQKGEPLATSYHSRFMGTVDYIWHTEELVPVRILETLSIDALTKAGGLPNERWGSDHLAIACELAFVDS